MRRRTILVTGAALLCLVIAAVGALRITGNTGTLPPPKIGPVHAVGNAVTGPVTVQP